MRFVPSSLFARKVAETREMQTALRRAAEAAAEEARRIAPVLTGAYRESIGVDSSSGVVRMVATDEGAAAIEFGTQDTPPFAPLRRGAEAAGLRRSK